MSNEPYDLVVIGAGPGGYVCAIKAAQLGLKVACVDQRETLGGTCLNVGCIPSKALLHSSHKFHEAKSVLREHGVECGKLELNLAQMMTRKDKVVSELTQGIAYLFKKNGVTFYQGTATLPKAGTVLVTSGKGVKEIQTMLQAKSTVIATGSVSADVPGIKVDEETVLSSTGALSLAKVPQTMIIVGGGYIGLELGSVWARLGTRVTVVEFADRIVPAMDQDVASALHQSLEKQGLHFKLAHKVTKVDASKKGVTATISPVDGAGKDDTLQADTLLVSVGRRPCTEGLKLKELGVSLTERGQIDVNERFETAVPGVYAIGDVIQGPMLAHKAEEEGVAVAEMLAGKPLIIDHHLIPAVVYTHPEVSTVGQSEADLKEAGVPYAVGKFPFKANSRAKAMGDTEGFVKILSHKETDKVLGAHIIGGTAGSLIAEVVAVMTYGGSAEDIGRICHAHPTESEAVKEAGLVAAGMKAIHI
ncbi:dihydrolipoyl dehydrogenase [Alphaproteobacteria bacterium]|nr:dihydrolipoyl dehydrogenase [Alphaproteobacteria bacterium]